KRKMTQTQADYYEFLEIEPILDDLRSGADDADGSRAWAQAGADAAHDEVQRLQGEVAALEAELAKIQEQLRVARDERLTLESESFTAGDDAAFARFRDKYLAVFDRMRDLEQTEQRLMYGSMSGEGDEAEVVLGLDALQRELALQQELAERYDAAVAALDRRIEHMQVASDEAHRGVVDYSERLKAHQAELEAMLPEMGKLAQQAFDAEIEALSSAAAARQAFSQANEAIRKWKADARQIEDPEGTNARLTMIKGDRYSEQLGASAEAAARMLEGRIHWHRFDGLARQIDAFKRLTDLVGTGTFEETKLREAMQTARDEGTKTLDQAVTLYQGLAGGPAETSWVHKSSLAATYYLLSKFNEDQRETLELQAAETLDTAVTPGEKSPYVADQVRFRDYLIKKTGYAAPTRNETTDEPAEELPDAGS
ncbi:MAG: hypothetical protein JXO22_05615, partial [Phycisphaerae bacterium]|nr:hypothetical protein [Phycisphaerae bacterium]